MIKKAIILLFIIMFFIMGNCYSGNFLGIKKSSEYIVMPILKPLDSAGIPGKPDSIHIFTYADKDASVAYMARDTFPFPNIPIDTTKNYGDTCYWFVDQIQDIDGVGANSELAISVITWYKKLPSYNTATVLIISDSLNTFFTGIRDTINGMATISEVAQAAADSLEKVGGILRLIGLYSGALGDSTIQVLFPPDGSSPKDSVVIRTVAGVRLGVVIYKHSNVSGVLDSIIVTTK